MKTKLTYNEYGAPLQNNPKWCDIISWMLYKVSSLFYPNHKSIYIWFQAEAYSWGDIQCLSGIKGYKK